MRPIPLVSYLRARPILLSWAESLGDTLDECPLPTPKQWVYFAGATGRCIKVGFTRNPQQRAFTCWRNYYRIPETYPMVLLSDCGQNVESLIKRAFVNYATPKRRWPREKIRELFPYSSPVLEMISELRTAAEGCWYQSEWFGVSPMLIERERSWRAFNDRRVGSAA